MRARCVAANSLWLASALPAALAFSRDLKRVGEVQERLLLRTLRRNGMEDVRSIREYQQRVPVSTYETHDFSRGLREPVERYERTSGSSGASKRIPYTRSLRREMQRAIAPWICSLAREHPGAFAGEAYWSVSPGGESDEEVLGPLARRLVRAVQAVPSSVRLANDYDSFRRDTLKQLLRCRTLSLISVWHPSFLDLLVGDGIDTEAAWPHLRVISCWADANAAGAAALLAAKFPHVTIQEKGLLSTEGFVSLPFEGANLLAYHSHFFEFRDEDGVRTADELQAGRRYGVILTTGGGLYRYDTEDLVEVTGFRESCPIVRFVGRREHVSDHFGEKLNEVFVRDCIEHVFGGTERKFVMLACEADRYVLFLESDAPDEELLSKTALLENALRDAFHYDYCRTLGQLAALRFVRVTGGAAKYLRAKSATQVLGDIKIPALEREGGWEGRLR